MTAPHLSNRFRSFMFYVYILQSERDGSTYVGCTSDLKRRFAEHNARESVYTKKRAPYRLVYYEAYRAKDDASRRERMLKLHAKGMAQLRRRIANSLAV